MQIVAADIDLTASGSTLRTRIAAPRAAGRYPGIVFYSEIFQLTGPIRRAMDRLAGYGFVVAAPEIFHGVESPGAVIPYDDAGRDRGMSDARQTSVIQHDRDLDAVLQFLQGDSRVAEGRIGAMGFCIGGHLALRAALDRRVKATVACYPTGVHSGVLGSDADAGTLARLGSVPGEIFVVFGEVDPHVPPEGRAAVARALEPLGVRRRILHVPGAEHAFMRDEGSRFDPAAADAVWADATAFFRRVLA